MLPDLENDAKASMSEVVEVPQLPVAKYSITVGTPDPELELTMLSGGSIDSFRENVATAIDELNSRSEHYDWRVEDCTYNPYKATVVLSGGPWTDNQLDKVVDNQNLDEEQPTASPD